MYLAQIHFRSKSPANPLVPNGSKVVDPIGTLVRQWWEGGQINDQPEHFIYHSARHSSTFVYLPEKGSLSARYTLPRARRTLESFAAANLLPPKVNLIGETVSITRPCRCKTPSAYVLFTHAYANESPVVCADCFDSIPLYRIPPHPLAKPDDEFAYEYRTIHTWQRDFRRLDLTWFNSGLGERSAHAQLSRINSALNIDGREVREDLEERLNRKVYYFLWANTMLGDDLPHTRPCPSCCKRWHLSKEVFTKFRHKCDECRLVAM